MPWFNVDDGLAFHRKVIKAGNAAMGLWVRAGAHCAHQLTDGFVDRDMVPSLGTMKQADRLVVAGLWERVAGGFQFHEYHAGGRNPLRAEVLARRSRNAERKAKQRVRIQADSREVQVGMVSPGGTHGGVTGGVTGGVNDPTPLHSTKEQQKTPSSAPRKRGTRIPDDFEVAPEMVAWAHEHTPTVDGRVETANFIDYWTAKAGSGATKLDWIATWRTWMRTAESRQGKRGSLRAVPGGYQPYRNPTDPSAYDEDL